MVDNINTNTMVGKVVAVCIALLFIVVLAFPIANSLGNMGKEDDGGGTGPITYTNTGDSYYKSTANDNIIHTVHLSYEWENLTETTSRDTYTLTLDNFVIFSYTFTWDYDNPADEPVPSIMPIGWDSERIFVVTLPEIGDYSFCETNGFTSFTPNIEIISTEDSDSGMDECSFTVQNGVITYTNSNNETVTSEYTMDYLYSTDDSGEYVLADTPFKTDTDSMLYVCDIGILDDSEHDMDWAVAIYGSINTSVLTSSPVSVNLQYRGGVEGTIQTTVTSTNENGLITVSKIESELTLTIPDREGTYYVTDTVSLKAIVPTTVTIDPSAPVEVTVTNSGQTYALTDDNTPSMTISVKEDNGHWQVYLGTWGNQYDQMVYECANNPDAIPMVLLCGGTEEASHTSNGYWLLSNGTILRNGTILPSNSVIGISGKYAEIHNHGSTYCDYYISSDGNYVYSTESKTLNESTIYVYAIWFDESADTYVSFGSKGTISNISENITVNTTNYSGITATNVSIDKTDKGGYTILNSITVTATDPSDSSIIYSGTADGFIVPKTFTYTESADSGSDSNGLGGIASTLVKLVPILLIIGVLLIFVMPMINKPS